MAGLRSELKDVKVERFTIWDNFERHVGELKAIGATDPDLVALRAAAEAVGSEEEKEALRKDENPVLEDHSLEEMTQPLECANGWKIAPPSLPAKRWATSAIMKVTGGAAPEDNLAILCTIIAGLLVLKLWGEGRRDQVMRLVCMPGALAEALSDVGAQVAGVDANRLSDDFARLMGTAKKKSQAKAIYEGELDRIRSLFPRPKPSAGSTATS